MTGREGGERGGEGDRKGGGGEGDRKGGEREGDRKGGGGVRKGRGQQWSHR